METKQPPRLRTIYVLGGFALVMTVALSFDARSLFEHPRDRTHGKQWHDQLLGAILYASVVYACLSYLRYRRQLARAGRVATVRPWHHRREVAIVIYTFVGMMCLRLPIGICTAVMTLRDTSTPGNPGSFWSLSPDGTILCPLIGVAAFRLHRRRAERERRRAEGLCLGCGYDLRASTVRCPECGKYCGPRQPSVV